MLKHQRMSSMATDKISMFYILPEVNMNPHHYLAGKYFSVLFRLLSETAERFNLLP